MERTITVTGNAALSLPVDTVEISLSFENRDPSYESAFTASDESLREIQDSLSLLGIPKEELKTQNFFVNTDYESVRDEDGMYHQVFKGYIIEHSLLLSVPFDTKKLSLVLSKIASLSSAPRLSLRFTVKEKEKYREELLRKVCDDAKEKALVISDQMGVLLDVPTRIDFSGNDLHFYSPTSYNAPMARLMKNEAKALDMDFAPEDISISQNGVFTWSIR